MFFNEPFGGVIPGAHAAVLATLLRTDTPLTGRQIHRLLSDEHSLWTVQEALKTLARLGLVESEAVGRARVWTVQDSHAAVGPLRSLLDPIAILRDAVRSVAQHGDVTVILFGSVARGEAHRESDIDLAVIAPAGWDRAVELEDHVHRRLGNGCDVLVFDEAEFDRLAHSDEPVVADLLTDGVVLVGRRPLPGRGVA